MHADTDSYVSDLRTMADPTHRQHSKTELDDLPTRAGLTFPPARPASIVRDSEREPSADIDTLTPFDTAGQTANGPPTQTHRVTQHIEVTITGTAAGTVAKDSSDATGEGRKLSTDDLGKVFGKRMKLNPRKRSTSDRSRAISSDHRHDDISTWIDGETHTAIGKHVVPVAK